MTAVARPPFPLGMGAPGAAAPAPAPAAAPAPGAPVVAFDMAAVNAGVDVSGYELSYGVYVASLQPSLSGEYGDPRGRRDPAPIVPPAVVVPPAGIDPTVVEIQRIKAFLNEAGRNRKPAAWYAARGREANAMNSLINAGIRDDPAIREASNAVPFDINAYRAAILAYINANNGVGFVFRSVGP